MSAPAYTPLQERLLDYALTLCDSDEVAQARGRFSGWTGESFSEDRSYEARTQAFLDWFLFDRRLSCGDTPARLFAASRSTPAQRTAARLMSRTVHGLFLVQRADAAGLDVENVLTGARYRPAADVALSSLQKGELFEGRLVPWSGSHHFSSAFVFHPVEMRGRILRELARVQQNDRQPVQEFVWLLARMASRAEHFRNIPIESLYDFGRPPPKATTPPMRFDPASVAERRARLAAHTGATSS